MKTLRYTHNLPIFSSNMVDRYFKGLRLGIFDIETLGLNPAASEVILAGFLAISEDGNCQAVQYFAENKLEERNVLLAVQEELKNYDYILTYNGKHFDLPFTTKRAVMKGLSDFSFGCYNLDLYLVLHGHSNLKAQLTNLRQKTVEDYMGFHTDRKDQISGADSIKLYETYLKTEDPAKKEELERKILLHNHDDLIQLYRILPVILKADLHRAMSYLGFPVAGAHGWPQLNIGKIRIDYTGLTIMGNYDGPGFSYISYDDGTSPYSCHFSIEGEFRFLLPTDRHKNSHYLNLRTVLPASAATLSKYPGYVNGFFILSENGKTNFLEVNMFAKALLCRFMEEVSCPR
ncbi:MAG: ribonuclease H-like domain-containing protein [Firmicutes bacterium]|nr:ribonuclease H-like domain-containing protein [Bacillota bacterium]